jgi:hypothetical protein
MEFRASGDEPGEGARGEEVIGISDRRFLDCSYAPSGKGYPEI